MFKYSFLFLQLHLIRMTYHLYYTVKMPNSPLDFHIKHTSESDSITDQCEKLSNSNIYEKMMWDEVIDVNTYN